VQEQDVDKRKALYDTIQRAHTDSSPFVYMFQDSRKVAMRSNVKGVVLGITFSDDRYGGVTKE
jgi:peptide/nickel transport system substrate-binding protein